LRIALSMADYRSCRDDASKKCVEQLGVTKPTLVYPDLAYDMAVEEPSTKVRAESDRPVIGINAVPFSDSQAWVGGGALVYEAYILKLATFALWLISRGYAVTFFPTQLRLDPSVVNDLIRVTTELSETNLEKHLLKCQINSFDDLTKFICMTDMIVATRFHGVVFSYLLNKPVLGIAYALKTRELMAQMGQADYALDIFQIDVEMLKERFIALEARQREIKDEISRSLSIHRLALARQYEEVFGLIRKSEI
jgi:polysaccharide pyruvyl transferase WcaK-like protein